MKKLDKRKYLASKVLGVGKGRIKFNSDRLADIKEAITKQDIRDLYNEGIITIKPIHGRRKVERRKTKRGSGKIKKRINEKKRKYVRLVRKLRRHIKEIKKQGKINGEEYIILRKKIKAREFKDKAHLKEHLGERK